MDFNDGIKFECQGSSNCCVSRGSYGYVYLSKKDILRLSRYTKLKVKDFINLYCDKTDDFTHLKEKKTNGKCQFLIKKKCSIYKARPTQCRTWPFWSENMNPKTWNDDIANFCPGIGMGQRISKKIIEKNVLEDELNEIKMLDKI